MKDQMMKAVVVSRLAEDLGGVALSQFEIPAIASNEVLVRVKAASLNPVDWKLAAGVAFPGWPLPHVAALDAAGVVEEAGAGVSAWRPGDRVVWHHSLFKSGVCAEYVAVPAHVLSRIPETVGDEAAAAVPCAGYTAYQGLIRKAHLKPEQWVVVQGASGGVGGFAVQVAALHGANVIALARPEQQARVRSLGAHHVIDYRRPNLKEEIRALTPGGYGADIMVEVVNPRDARKSLELLHYNGQLITVDPLPDLSQTPAYTYAASIHEVALGGAYGAGYIPTQEDFARIGDWFMGELAAKRLSPMIEHTVGMEQVPDYLRQLKAGDIVGKIVVKIE